MVNIKNNDRIVSVILGISIAEILIFNGYIFYGIEIHIMNLFLILFSICFMSSKAVGVLHSLILLILIRMIYLSIPQLFSGYIQYLLIFGIMLVPIYLTIKCQQCQQQTNELGILDKRYIRLSLTTTVGFFLDMLHNSIIKPDPSVLYLGGEMVTIFLIICLSISLLLPDKYLDQKHISYSLNICSVPMMLTFVAILIFRIISII